MLHKLILMISDPEEKTRLQKLYGKQGFKEGSIEIIFIRALDTDGIDDGTMFVSDRGEICAELRRQGFAVAADLHGNNRDEDFSDIPYILDDVWELEERDLDHIYRRLKGLACDILETERLYIRETRVADVDRFVELYSDPSITSFIEDLFEPEKEKEYQQKYIDNIYSFYDCGIWTLCLKPEDRTVSPEETIIGRMGVEMTEEEGLADMGFMLGTGYQGQGYATEAGRAVLKYAFTIPGIERVRARVHRDNHASRRVCERLGMSTKGETCGKNGEMLIYDMIKKT